VANGLTVERRGDALWLRLDRPEKLNAIDLALRDALWEALTLARDDPTLRAVVFEGAGDRAFSAGADISEFGTAPSLLDAREARLRRDLWGLLSSLELPLIAALHGFAYGAGLELALACDLRLAAEGTLLALPEVALGYIPAAGGTQLLPRQLPSGEAARMLLTGDPLDAERALELGLVHAVVPRAELRPTAEAWAARLAAADRDALHAAKRAVLAGLELPLEQGLALERRLADVVAAGGRAVGAGA
jgi:enoyl-CoA hydratase/carnithine racemase